MVRGWVSFGATDVKDGPDMLCSSQLTAQDLSCSNSDMAKIKADHIVSFLVQCWTLHSPEALVTTADAAAAPDLCFISLYQSQTATEATTRPPLLNPKSTNGPIAPVKIKCLHCRFL